MQKLVRARTLSLATMLLLAVSMAAGGQDSSLVLSLHEQSLNRLAASVLPHSESRRYQGEIELGITRQPWAVDTKFTVQALRTTVKPGNIGIEAQVRVQAAGLDQIRIAHGVLHPVIEGGKLILFVREVTLPLQVSPLGVPIDLGSIPAEHFLPEPLRRVEIDLLGLAVPVELAGGRTASLRVTGARLELKPPYLLIHASLGM